jgi:hypothetical protein
MDPKTLSLVVAIALAWASDGFISNAAVTPAPNAPVQRRESKPLQVQTFIPIEGPNLEAKRQAAIVRARAASPRNEFWVAHQFTPRPGVVVEAEWVDGDGKRGVMTGGVWDDNRYETRNLGVFVRYDAAGERIVRLDVHNLERTFKSEYPVFWLGQTTNAESLDFLERIVNEQAARKECGEGVMAIGLHDHARVAGILKAFAAPGKTSEIRRSAVFWLGQIEGQQAFLTDLIRNENEEQEIRKQSAFSLGVSKDPGVIGMLEQLYQSVQSREVRKQIIFAASVNRDADAAARFLIQAATSEKDTDVRKQAIFWLGQKAGKKNLDALADTIDHDPETDVQKQAVFAVSQRPADESVPILIKVARTHPKPAVRKQAYFWLGQTGDTRAVEFFKEQLLK